jgi:hypothetical protein
MEVCWWVKHDGYRETWRGSIHGASFRGFSIHIVSFCVIFFCLNVLKTIRPEGSVHVPRVIHVSRLQQMSRDCVISSEDTERSYMQTNKFLHVTNLTTRRPNDVVSPASFRAPRFSLFSDNIHYISVLKCALLYCSIPQSSISFVLCFMRSFNCTCYCLHNPLR